MPRLATLTFSLLLCLPAFAFAAPDAAGSAISAAFQAAADICRGRPDGPKGRLTAPSYWRMSPSGPSLSAVAPDIHHRSDRSGRAPARQFVLAVAGGLAGLAAPIFRNATFQPAGA